MLQVIGIAIAALICCLILKDKAPSFAIIISLASICIISLIVFTQIKAISNDVGEIISQIPSSVQYVKLMIKVLLISIITQVVTDICRDYGESSLAGIIEISAKILIVAMILPLFKTIISLILGLVK